MTEANGNVLSPQHRDASTTLAPERAGIAPAITNGMSDTMTLDLTGEETTRALFQCSSMPARVVRASSRSHSLNAWIAVSSDLLR